MNSEELKRRGQQMRIEIELLCNDLKNHESLRPGPNKIDSTVQKYIPTGLPFECAIVLLRGGGFNVDPLPPRPAPTNPPPWYRAEDRFMVFGTTILDSGPYYKISATVSVSPSNHDVIHSTVKDVVGVISFSSL